MEPENFVCSSFTQLGCRTSAQGRVETDFWFRTFLTAEMETATKLVTTAPICPASQSAKDLRVMATRQQAGLSSRREGQPLIQAKNGWSGPALGLVAGRLPSAPRSSCARLSVLGKCGLQGRI